MKWEKQEPKDPNHFSQAIIKKTKMQDFLCKKHIAVYTCV